MDSADNQLATRELFGGAMSIELPGEMRDIRSEPILIL